MRLLISQLVHLLAGALMVLSNKPDPQQQNITSLEPDSLGLSAFLQLLWRHRVARTRVNRGTFRLPILYHVQEHAPPADPMVGPI